MISQVSVPVRA